MGDFKEFNPFRDMDEVKFKFGYLFRENEDYFNNKCEKMNDISHIAKSIKTVYRGGLVGGIIGAFYSYFTESNLEEGINLGFKIGAGIDFLQYGVQLYFKGREDYQIQKILNRTK